MLAPYSKSSPGTNAVASLSPAFTVEPPGGILKNTDAQAPPRLIKTEILEVDMDIDVFLNLPTTSF